MLSFCQKFFIFLFFTIIFFNLLIFLIFFAINHYQNAQFEQLSTVFPWINIFFGYYSLFFSPHFLFYFFARRGCIQCFWCKKADTSDLFPIFLHLLYIYFFISYKIINSVIYFFILPKILYKMTFSV